MMHSLLSAPVIISHSYHISGIATHLKACGSAAQPRLLFQGPYPSTLMLQVDHRDTIYS